MPCYVDQPIFPFRQMMMCHLWADTDAELLAMVDQIGVDRKWIQGHPTLSFGKHRSASWIHFDISQPTRARAIAAGAFETDRYGPVYFVAKRRDRPRIIEAIEDVRRKAGRPVNGILATHPPEQPPHSLRGTLPTEREAP